MAARSSDRVGVVGFVEAAKRAVTAAMLKQDLQQQPGVPVIRRAFAAAVLFARLSNNSVLVGVADLGPDLCTA
jgi:hypothetical protein